MPRVPRFGHTNRQNMVVPAHVNISSTRPKRPHPTPPPHPPQSTDLSIFGAEWGSERESTKTVRSGKQAKKKKNAQKAFRVEFI